jgi:hypothetical protein
MKVVFRLDWKRLESALIEVAETGLAVGPFPPLDVQVRAMLDERRKVAIVFGPQDHVPVVWHHAVAADPHRPRPQGLSDRLDEGIEVGGRFEYGPPTDGPVQNVKRHTTGRDSTWTRHVLMYMPQLMSGQITQIWWLAPFQTFQTDCSIHGRSGSRDGWHQVR